MDEEFMRKMASKDHACTRHDNISEEMIDGYASRHPVTKGMGESERRVWDSLDDEDRRMIQSDRAYYGTDDGGGETEVSFYDVLGIRQFD